MLYVKGLGAAGRTEVSPAALIGSVLDLISARRNDLDYLGRLRGSVSFGQILLESCD
jgi:hypothetical protein